MTFRFAAASALLALAACANETPVDEADTTEAADPQTEIGAELDAIFAEYTPWDPDRDGVQTTESGLQYIVLRSAPEGAQPQSPRDTVTVMYDGRLAETGEKFDSSYERGRPASFALNRVIRGWTEGLQLMREGEDFLFFIPSELGYGDNPRPGGVIKPGDDLLFRVELQDIEFAPPPKAADAEAWSTYVPWNSDLPDIQTTGTGLEYVVLESGDPEGVPPLAADQVVVHYEGRLNETGETFDSSFPQGQPAVFPAGRLIPGFVEALSLMRPGDRWLVYLPSRIAYGETGTPGGPIPPYADLVFELELIDVLRAG